MRNPSPTRSTLLNPASDVDRAYLEDLAAVPRFDAECETVCARAVVDTRQAYWAVLLDPDHLEDVLTIIVERGRDSTMLALAERTRRLPRSATTTSAAVRDLVAAADRVGDEHAVSDAIVDLASQLDPRWHREAVRAREAFHTARNRFVRANLRLVLIFARRDGRNIGALADRIQDGNLGLMKAVDRFDPARGVRFSTYAGWWIRHGIASSISHARSMVWVPPQVQRLFFRSERAKRRLHASLGREPELREIAMELDCDPKRLRHAIDSMELRSVSLDGARREGTAVAEAASLCDHGSLADLEAAVERGDRDRAVAAIARLSPRERDIVHERYEFPGANADSLEKLGRRHGISRERARQLQGIALHHLRRALEPRATLERHAR